ncbi:MAG: PKD domain-containing protein [Saprospirales bacterium]|nr:PKD domain-containing protein [Saprospirales bacterium]
MRKPFTLIPAIVLAFFLLSSAGVRAQLQDTAFIVGPTEVCIGQCATYFIQGLSPNCPNSYLWFLSNGVTLTNNPGGTQTGITICWDQIIGFQPGVYTLFSEVDCPVEVIPLTILVQDFFQPEIYPFTNSACGIDSLVSSTDCLAACANSTVTYATEALSAPPTGSGLIWTVSGAQSYTVEDNFITVTWGSQGTGFIALIVNGICPGENSICVEILDEPVADFTTQPPPNAGVVSICEGQTVFFENGSQGADVYGWFFDVLGVSTQANTEFTFNTPGTYEVSLVARNECGCSDTTSMTVQVEAAEPPLIYCTGSVCAGETVTYITAANCTTYNWNVVGSANILGGGGPTDNSITIEWLDGPYGIIELDVSACAATYCSEGLVERIPVMTPNAPIEGPNEVCRGETVTYAIPEYDGSSYAWTVSSQGQIVAGQGTNQVTVLWDGVLTTGLTEWVQVEYENCFLECSGMSILPVGILNEFYLSGPIVACDGSSSSYLANNLYPLGGPNWNWEVQSTGGAVLWNSAVPAPGATINWTFGPGTYRVQATTASPGLYCQDVYSVIVVVNELPGAPTAIDGPALICPGNAGTYTAVSGQPNSIFDWTINDGGLISTQQGNSVVLTWGAAPPYELSVTQSSPGGPACTSGPATLVLQAISSLSLSAPSESCIEGTSILSADNLAASGYNWSFNPTDAGTILSGAGTHEVEVLWHVSGPVSVDVSYCGESANANLAINPFPNPDPVFPTGVCTGSTEQITTATPFAAYQWLDENGVLVSAAPDPQLGPGAYELVVTNAAGCEANTSFTIEEYPLPEVIASTPDASGYCTVPHATLYGTATGSGYDYQWYYNGAPVGGNTSSFVDIGFGLYYVEVTDANGCTAVSNTMEIFLYCPADGSTTGGGMCIPGGGGGVPTSCDPGTSVQFQILPPTADCAEGVFQDISPDVVPGSLVWSFGDGTGSNNQGPILNHIYSQAGFYEVMLTGISISTGELCWDSHIVTIPAAADFYAGPGCEAGLTQFTDRSTFVPTETITDWAWDFGDPASGAANFSNLQSPGHSYANAGIYTVTLTITAAGGCQSSIARQVEVHPLPVLAFDLPAFNCEGTPLEFIAQAPPEVISVGWDFGDPGSGNANEASSFSTFHAFSNAGPYSVGLEGTTVYGCIGTASLPLTVDPNGLSGDISSVPDPPQFCEGDQATLSSPAGGISWSWSDGQSTESVDVLVEDVFEVTLTDAMGCQYTPDPIAVDVIPAPNAVISAVEYNEYGQPVGIFFNAYSTCEGEDVFLQIEGAPGYTYTWSNGDTGDETVYADWRNNALTVGIHPITVLVVDQSTGCTTTIGPFNVTVNALPDPFQIQASNNPACAGLPTALSVASPDPSLTYVWTTGETGASIEVVLPGDYNAVAINASGCRRDGDTQVTVQPGPYLGSIPSGCHTQCNPDTICIPDLAGVVSYQWYFGGVPIPAPQGTVADLPITQSGVYFVEMVDLLGCTATSEPLILDLYDGYGTISGNVYMDVNENGIIDGPDTLVQGVGIELWEAGALVGSVFSGLNGAYSFPNILSTDYTVQLDTSSIPAQTTYYQIWQADASLVGCDDSETLNWLLTPFCAPTFSTLNLAACQGEGIDFMGVSIPAGGSSQFSLQNTGGCDSLLTVVVAELLPDAEFVNLVGCEGSTVTYNGVPLLPGTQTDFLFSNSAGCDSTVTVTVVAVAGDTTVVALELCPNETINYLGLTLEAGDEVEVVLSNWQGCDSLIQVSVTGFPEVVWDATSDPSCWNSGSGSILLNIQQGDGPFQFSLNGGGVQTGPLFEELPAGAYTIEITDINGCKYEGPANVEEIPPITAQVDVGAWDCKSFSAQVFASLLSGQGNFSWPDNSGGPFWDAETPGVYTLQIQNQCETVMQSFEVVLPDDIALSPVYLPNMFSPNGDGINDSFRGYAADGVQVLSYELLVFDRWGNLLFEAGDLESGWDGRLNFKPMDPAVFVYYIRATFINCGQEQSVFKKGDVTLIR